MSQAHLLKRQPDTPQGLRCGEMHTLRVKSIDLEGVNQKIP